MLIINGVIIIQEHSVHYKVKLVMTNPWKTISLSTMSSKLSKIDHVTRICL